VFKIASHFPPLPSTRRKTNCLRGTELCFLIVFVFSDKEVKENLAHYLSEARGLRPEMEHLLQVCQLFVHCWEVSFGIISKMKYPLSLELEIGHFRVYLVPLFQSESSSKMFQVELSSICVKMRVM